MVTASQKGRQLDITGLLLEEQTTKETELVANQDSWNHLQVEIQKTKDHVKLHPGCNQQTPDCGKHCMKNCLFVSQCQQQPQRNCKNKQKCWSQTDQKVLKAD